MAQTWEQYMIRLHAFRNSLPALKDELAVKLPITALSDVSGRVIDTGIDADGNPIGPYSDGYVALKKSKGRYKGHVDLQLTGRMWNDTDIVARQTTDDGFIVAIQPKSQENQKKMDANAERFGIDPLDMSQGEQDELALDADGLIQRHMDKYLEGTL